MKTIIKVILALASVIVLSVGIVLILSEVGIDLEIHDGYKIDLIDHVLNGEGTLYIVQEGVIVESLNYTFSDYHSMTYLTENYYPTNTKVEIYRTRFHSNLPVKQLYLYEKSTETLQDYYTSNHYSNERYYVTFYHLNKPDNFTVSKDFTKNFTLQEQITLAPNELSNIFTPVEDTNYDFTYSIQDWLLNLSDDYRFETHRTVEDTVTCIVELNCTTSSDYSLFINKNYNLIKTFTTQKLDKVPETIIIGNPNNYEITVNMKITVTYLKTVNCTR